MSKGTVLISVLAFLGTTWSNVVYPRYKIDKPQGIIEDLINSTLELLRDNISEPILFDDINTSLTTNFSDGYLNVTNIALYGLNTFEAQYIQVRDLINVDVTLRVPMMVPLFDYVLDLVIARIVPIYGGGPFNGTIIGATLNISTTADIQLSPPAIRAVKNTTAILTIEGFGFDFHGLFNDPWVDQLVNDILDELVANFINKYTQIISGVISPIIEELINSTLMES